MRRVTAWLSRAAGLSIMVVVAVLLGRYLAAIRANDVLAAWNAISPRALALSLSCTATSFACLAGYEWLATRAIAPGRLGRSFSLQVGWMSHALSNALGFHVFTGGAFRMHAYASSGLRAGEIAKVMAFVGACVATGVASISLMAIVGLRFQARHPMQAFAISAIALVCLALAAAITRRMRPGVAMPGRELATAVLLGSLEMTSAIAALYILLPGGLAPGFPEFVLLFVAAMLLGVLSHAPGGIGVFEATMLARWPEAAHPRVLAVLLAYRLVYNVLPFALAAIVLCAPRVRAAFHARRDGARGAGGGPAPADGARRSVIQFEGG